jgi:hypothetical protein
MRPAPLSPLLTPHTPLPPPCAGPLLPGFQDLAALNAHLSTHSFLAIGAAESGPADAEALSALRARGVLGPDSEPIVGPAAQGYGELQPGGARRVLFAHVQRWMRHVGARTG